MELINPENLVLTHGQLMLSLPYFVILLGAVLALIFGVSKRFEDQLMTKGITVATGLLGVVAVFSVWGEPTATLFNRMLAADQFANVFNVLFLVVTVLVAISSFPYLTKQGVQHPEYYSLLLFACMGMMLLASALDLIVLFVALELMSIAVYVLVGFKRAEVRSNEAALKYFILGSAASAVFLYGVALIYGAMGTMNMQEIAAILKSGQYKTNTLFVLGSIFVIAGYFFKVAAVPFHTWMPDVYEGAPATITGFMTTGLKAAAFASFLRVFSSFGYLDGSHAFEASRFHDLLWVVAVATMFLGNVIALVQTNIKRMLAFSSISHTGYLLVGIMAGSQSESGYAPVIMYLITYCISNLGAFAIVAHLSGKGDTLVDIQDFSGLGFKKPVLGFAMMVFMLSMAGVPPTAGFIGKYLMFNTAVQAGEVWLTVLAVLCSAISAYYYLRIIVMMYMKEPLREFQPGYAVSATFVASVTVLSTLQMGLFPSWAIEVARVAALNLVSL